MKLLQRKIDIDKSQAQERKREIDYGLNLAKSVDKIRETKLTEEKSLKEWRESSIKSIQQEIDSYIEVKENLRIATEKAEKYRKELIEPLDQEWEEVNEMKAKVLEEKQSVYIVGEQLKIKEQEIEDTRKTVDKFLSKIINNEKSTEKLKQEAEHLKKMASKEYELSRSEHSRQTDMHEQKMSDLSKRETEYEVATQTIQIRENQVKEKESELIIRENDLARRMKNFQKAQEVLKK